MTSDNSTMPGKHIHAFWLFFPGCTLVVSIRLVLHICDRGAAACFAVPIRPETPEMIGYLYCASLPYNYPLRDITFTDN